jgi:hypothetical protein
VQKTGADLAIRAGLVCWFISIPESYAVTETDAI